MLFFLSMGFPLHLAALHLMALVLAISFHEAAHGYAAHKLGDSTARNLGKITLDPRAHFSRMTIFMMLIFPIAFGSCPINPRNFRKPARDERLVAAAGPFSNLLLGFACFFVMSAIAYFFIPGGSALAVPWGQLATTLIWINVWLFILNLIPIPPLDGFKIISFLLPWKTRESFYRIEQYGFLILILIINFFRYPLNIAMTAIIAGMSGLIPWA